MTTSFFSMLVAVPENVSAYTPHAPIYIDGNSGFTNASGVVWGSGTELDPYIIEGWEIDLYSLHSPGIHISNTNAHFIIRNVFAHSGNWDYMIIVFDGIYMNNVANGYIEQCILSDNQNGIGLWNSNNINITCNDFSNNYWGVQFYQCTDIKVYHNNYITVSSWNLQSNSNLNWDNDYPDGGNYWSYSGSDQYSGPNQDIPGSDGICDTPYVIDSNNQDNYPLMEPYSPIINESPIADFTYSSSYLSVDFNASASYDPDGTIVSYDWDFGDGFMGSGVTTSHMYTIAGNYSVSLTVIDDDGAEANAVKNVMVIEEPPIISTGNMTVIRETPGGPKRNIVSMNFTPEHNGVWWAEIEDNGLSAVRIEIFDITDGSQILVLSERIGFGGDKYATKISSRVDVISGNTYILSATPGGRNGAYAKVTGWFERLPNEAPVAIPFITPSQAFVGDIITCDASSSYDSDGMIVEWLWNFGDGETGTGEIVYHIYSILGNFTITLITIDDSGMQSIPQNVVIEIQPAWNNLIEWQIDDIGGLSGIITSQELIIYGEYDGSQTVPDTGGWNGYWLVSNQSFSGYFEFSVEMTINNAEGIEFGAGIGLRAPGSPSNPAHNMIFWGSYYYEGYENTIGRCQKDVSGSITRITYDPTDIEINRTITYSIVMEESGLVSFYIDGELKGTDTFFNEDIRVFLQGAVKYSGTTLNVSFNSPSIPYD